MSTPRTIAQHDRSTGPRLDAPGRDPHSPDEPVPEAVGALRLIPVGDRLWRVVGATGIVVGHLRVDGEGARRRFVARRLRAPGGSFRDVGAFWTLREALECLRLSR